jgi:SAM-dependent methyltransferase
VLKTEPLFSTYQQIFDHYKAISDKLLLNSSSALKTDCYNEGFGRPVVTNSKTKLLEYNQEHINKAKEQNPLLDITKGDIRHLPFKDGQFDLLLDLSTLDHILPSQIDETLKGYARVLKPKGVFLLITWLSPNQVLDQDWSSDGQYFFDYAKLKGLLERDFSIDSEELLFTRSDKILEWCHLYQFLCHK